MQPNNQQHQLVTDSQQQNLGSVPLLSNLSINSNIEGYFQHYQNFLSGFKGNVDCRVIPSKKGGSSLTLTKAGAEKICQFFSLNYGLFLLPQTQIDFQQGIFYYAYECRLFHSGIVVGNGFGSCNSFESKYNSSKVYLPDVVNTIDKMAQKRAFISAVLFTTGGSRFFGPKLDDLNS
ncbi:MAG: hypothetical protein AAFQ80_07965 [Cyanobacteria bacterium J06621_8]